MRSLKSNKTASSNDAKAQCNWGSSRGAGGRATGGRTTHEAPVTPATCAAFPVPGPARPRPRPPPARPCSHPHPRSKAPPPRPLRAFPSPLLSFFRFTFRAWRTNSKLPRAHSRMALQSFLEGRCSCLQQLSMFGMV
jgi:hypothetical protein